jgi:predicted enzyme related to lactoylglutathione lyase
MNLRCQHAVVRVTSITKAKEFYTDKLSLKILEETPNFFAAKAGEVRLSFFEGYEKLDNGEEPKTGVSLILRVDNLNEAISEILKKGVKIKGDIIDIPKFHKFQEIEDPDGNILYLAEYHVEPV